MALLGFIGLGYGQVQDIVILPRTGTGRFLEVLFGLQWGLIKVAISGVRYPTVEAALGPDRKEHL